MVDPYSEKPFREGPLKELLKKRGEKSREELLKHLDVMLQVSMMSNGKSLRFEVIKNLVEVEVFDED